MISEIIKAIQSDEWKGVSQNMEIAKGKYATINTWGGVWKYIKRLIKWPRK